MGKCVCIFLLLLSSYLRSQNNDTCNIHLDLGYGIQRFCDSSLIKAGYFNYNQLATRIFKVSEVKLYNDSIYTDTNITFVKKNRKICIRRNSSCKGLTQKSLLSLYNKGISRKNRIHGDIDVLNGFYLEWGINKMYLFYLFPTHAMSSRVSLKGILCDLSFSSKRIKITSFPNFQLSNSYCCLGNNNEGGIDFISLDIFSKYNKVSLYHYKANKFMLDKRYYLTLTPEEDGFLYKIQKNKSKWF
jgi:hypothetical protein